MSLFQRSYKDIWSIFGLFEGICIGSLVEVAYLRIYYNYIHSTLPIVIDVHRPSRALENFVAVKWSCDIYVIFNKMIIVLLNFECFNALFQINPHSHWAAYGLFRCFKSLVDIHFSQRKIFSYNLALTLNPSLSRKHFTAKKMPCSNCLKTDYWPDRRTFIAQINLRFISSYSEFKQFTKVNILRRVINSVGFP